MKNASTTKGAFLALAFLALCLVPGLNTPSRAGVFNPETFTLANGMRVVVIGNHRVPVVTHMVWYGVGSADEGPGESGIAHFLEHLMFKGTKKRQPGEFSKILARNGGRENAFTSADYTAYFQTVAVDRLEIVMEMEADRMTNLRLTEQGVAMEKAVVLEERRSRTDNNPSSILREQVNAAKLKPLAEKYYGRIPAHKPTARVRPAEPPQSTSRRLVYKDARVRQPAWSRTYLAPSYLTGETGHAYALEVLADIFGAGATSRLYQSLVVENKIAISAGSYYAPDARGPGRFSLHASPKPGVSMETLEKAMEAELMKILTQGGSASEVARAKKRMRAQAVYARDSLQGGARALGAALAIGMTVEDVEAWPDRIGTVTVEQVNAVAKAVLKEGRSVTALLLQKKTG